jgi:hypothetical protein
MVWLTSALEVLICYIIVFKKVKVQSDQRGKLGLIFHKSDINSIWWNGNIYQIVKFSKSMAYSFSKFYVAWSQTIIRDTCMLICVQYFISKIIKLYLKLSGQLYLK